MMKKELKLPGGLAERFQAVEDLGAGRMSRVVRAEEISSGRQVALKILHESLIDSEPVRRRLRRELAAVRRIDHPAVVRVDDLIEEDDVVALVMEFIDGESVRRRIRRDGPIDWEEARPILADVLAGLKSAHDQGILHRDLNAEHVLIDGDGRGRIVGFGMARVDELVAITMHTRVLGALEAMAPERVLGMEYDGRADLYSVGAVAHEMILGHAPVDGTMHAAFLRAADEAATLERLPDEVPEAARYLLERSLVGDRSARFATAQQMARALDGSYDEAMWQAWASREANRCPECEAPVIDGLESCMACGHQFNRLVQSPGTGDWMIQAISPRAAFDKDVWFETNPEPDYYDEKTVDRLMDFLESYEDTRRFADRSHQYQWPPYILFDELSAQESRRIADLLDEIDIPNRRTNDERFLSESRSNRGGWRLFLPILLAVVSVGILTGILVFNEMPRWVLAVVQGGFFGSLAVTLSVLAVVKARQADLEDDGSTGQQIHMIPSASLMAGAQLSDQSDLAAEVGQVLRRLDDDGVRQEIYELVLLLIGLGEEFRREYADQVASIVERMLELGRRLDETRKVMKDDNAADLVDQLERVDAEIDGGHDLGEADDLLGRRRVILENLEARDGAVHQEAMLQARLLALRGALLDLRARSDEEEQVVFDFQGSGLDSFTEMEILVAADEEVRQMTAEKEAVDA